uniref:Uncharacterized protein n=1 Tax=Hyaloperonospora arabidopsidis (strain Emoy2) TaxID=559515 RepID=M4C0P3_HYAAE
MSLTFFNTLRTTHTLAETTRNGYVNIQDLIQFTGLNYYIKRRAPELAPLSLSQHSARKTTSSLRLKYRFLCLGDAWDRTT